MEQEVLEGRNLEAPRSRKKRQPASAGVQPESGPAVAASETSEGRKVRRAKGVNQQEMVKTHGLPEPDGQLNKGRIFEAILAPLAPGKLLDLGAGNFNYTLKRLDKYWANDTRATERNLLFVRGGVPGHRHGSKSEAAVRT